MKEFVLYIVLAMPMREPVLLENNEKFESQEECVAVGEVKVVEVARRISELSGGPVSYRWWCEGPEGQKI